MTDSSNPVNTPPTGLKCHHRLTVEVENEDDQAPVFDPAGIYVVDVLEDAVAGFVLTTITVEDTDIGAYGIVQMKVDPANIIANKYFGIGPVSHNNNDNVADLIVIGALDVEADTVVRFDVIASDTNAAHDTTQEVNIRIHNVNDNRPKFVPDFYNYEVSSTAEKGKFIIQVTATDDDISKYSS